MATDSTEGGREDCSHLPTDTESGSIEKKAAISPDAAVKDADLDFPDGGLRAWLVVASGVAATFSSFGFVNAWGVFQAHYSTNLLSHVPPSTIAWIGSIQYALVFALGIIWGRLFDLGIFRISLGLSSSLLILATFLTAQCKEYWQFFLCQGVAIGIGSGGVFGPTLAVVAHWFKKRRATAYGIVATGSSIGGTVVPIAVDRLIPRVGFPWTMRILGIILLFSLAFLNIVTKRRLPPIHVSGGLFNFKAFKYPPFTIYTASSFVSFLGLYTVLTYIDLSATSAGIDPSFDVYFLAIANASSFIGRVLSGYLSDRLGCLNVMIPTTLLAAVTTFAWPFAHSVGSLVAIAVVYGISSGTFVALIAVPLIHMGEVGDVGRRSGMLFTVTSISALIGPPISGAIAQRTGGYEAVGYYAGSTVVFCVLLMWIVRYMLTGHIFKGKC